MAEKKITIRVDETIYESFKALCEANGFRLTILSWTPLVTLMPLSSLQLPDEMKLKEQKRLLKLYSSRMNLDKLTQILGSS